MHTEYPPNNPPPYDSSGALQPSGKFRLDKVQTLVRQVTTNGNEKKGGWEKVESN